MLYAPNNHPLVGETVTHRSFQYKVKPLKDAPTVMGMLPGVADYYDARAEEIGSASYMDLYHAEAWMKYGDSYTGPKVKEDALNELLEV